MLAKRFSFQYHCVWAGSNIRWTLAKIQYRFFLGEATSTTTSLAKDGGVKLQEVLKERDLAISFEVGHTLKPRSYRAARVTRFIVILGSVFPWHPDFRWAASRLTTFQLLMQTYNDICAITENIQYPATHELLYVATQNIMTSEVTTICTLWNRGALGVGVISGWAQGLVTWVILWWLWKLCYIFVMHLICQGP